MFSAQWKNQWGAETIEPDKPCFRLIERRSPGDGVGWATYDDATIHGSFSNANTIPHGNVSLDVSRAPWSTKYSNIDPIVFIKPAAGRFVSMVGIRKIGTVIRCFFHCSTRNSEGVLEVANPYDCIESVYVFGPISGPSSESYGARVLDAAGDVMFDGGYPILRVDRVVVRAIAGVNMFQKINPVIQESDGYFAKPWLAADAATVELGGRDGSSIVSDKFAWTLTAPSGLLLTRKIQKLDQKGFWPIIWYDSLGYVTFTSAYAYAFDRNLNARFSPYTLVQDGSWGTYDALNISWPSIDRYPSSYVFEGLVQSFVGIDTTEFDKYLG